MRRLCVRVALTASLISIAATAGAAPGVREASVFRKETGDYLVNWKADDPKAPVAIFVASAPDHAAPRKMVIERGKGGSAVIPASAVTGRGYFHVVVNGGRKDPMQDGIWAGERVLRFERASNFRDLGGYETADGRHVRWGMIYRSGAPAMLSAQDLEQVGRLNITTTIDLRSNEERRMTPSLLADDAKRRTIARDYSMQSLIPESSRGAIGLPKIGGYGSVASTLAPLFRQVFDVLETEQGAVHYHCTAGQDRAGMTSALILAALGVPRETILRDYHLSTTARRPQFEMPPIDLSKFPNDPIAAFFAKAKADGSDAAQPLYGEDGQSILAATFDMIDARWGSVDNYLREVIGLTDGDLEKLRAKYLE